MSIASTDSRVIRLASSKPVVPAYSFPERNLRSRGRAYRLEMRTIESQGFLLYPTSHATFTTANHQLPELPRHRHNVTWPLDFRRREQSGQVKLAPRHSART